MIPVHTGSVMWNGIIWVLKDGRALDAEMALYSLVLPSVNSILTIFAPKPPPLTSFLIDNGKPVSV